MSQVKLSRFQMPRNLHREGATAAAGFASLWVLEAETLTIDALMPIDRCAIQIEGTLFVDDDGYAMLFVLGVLLFIVFIIESQRIAKSAATTS